MKTITHYFSQIVTSLAILTLTSCVSSQQVSHQPAASSPQRISDEGCWYKVRDNPPVYYPVGVSKDAATDYRQGQWVFAGEGNTMWFVPNKGAGGYSAQQLISQAMSKRTAEQVDLVRRDGIRETVFGTIGATVLTTLTVATVSAQIVASEGHVEPNPHAIAEFYERSLSESPMGGLFEALRFREKLYPPEAVAEVSKSSSPGSHTRGNDDRSIPSLNREADVYLEDDARRAVNINLPRFR